MLVVKFKCFVLCIYGKHESRVNVFVSYACALMKVTMDVKLKPMM